MFEAILLSNRIIILDAYWQISMFVQGNSSIVCLVSLHMGSSPSTQRASHNSLYLMWSARVVKKPYCFFEKVFFQRACRIILGPPKHVLHLVWSAFVKYTANRTASKVALYDCFDGLLAPLNGQFMTKVDY